MSHNYPIWHNVTACIYKLDKSYGAKNDSKETIFVGTSAVNSHKHCDILTTRRTIYHEKYGECYIFRTSIDGIVLKETLVSINERKMVQQRTKLNRIKSL